MQAAAATQLSDSVRCDKLVQFVSSSRVSVALLPRLVVAVDVLLLLANSVVGATYVAAMEESRLAALVVSGIFATVASVGLGGVLRLNRLDKLPRVGLQVSGFTAVLLGAAAVAWFIRSILEPSSLDHIDWFLVWLIGAWSVLIAWRLLVAAGVSRGVANESFCRRVAVVGAGALSQEVAEQIGKGDTAFVRMIGLFDDGPAPAGVVLRGRVSDLVVLGRQERIDAIVLGVSDAPEVMAGICDQFRATCADIYLAAYVPSADPSTARRVEAQAVALLKLRPLDEWQRLQKDCFDKLLSFALLVTLLPLLLLIAVAIRLEGAGPVLFRQPRIGFNNVPFTMLKFRSMRHDMQDLLADRQTSRDDPRVTRVGKYLRKLSLDELPQLLNVLRGDMSLVGPRPHAPNTRAEGRRLEDVVANYAERHLVKPGLTGWAQVNGARGEIRLVKHIQERVRLDLEYARKWSLWLDVRIMVTTLLREIISPRAF